MVPHYEKWFIKRAFIAIAVLKRADQLTCGKLIYQLFVIIQIFFLRSFFFSDMDHF